MLAHWQMELEKSVVVIEEWNSVLVVGQRLAEPQEPLRYHTEHASKQSSTSSLISQAH